MSSDFLLYGSYGFVGQEIARLAVQDGLRPLLAGRDAARLEAQAAELGLEQRAFSLDDGNKLCEALKEVPVVLHCAGPYLYTSKQMVDACLSTQTHYLDITGEIPVYSAIADKDAEAKSQGVMLLPGVGFDVVPTDCLALHLKGRLPSATSLVLAFRSRGPAGLPPGTVRTMIEMASFGIKVRREGELVQPEGMARSRSFDFGHGPVEASLISWGDIFMAYHTTGIPNIANYSVLSIKLIETLRARDNAYSGSTPEQRLQTKTYVVGEVEDGEGNKAAARLEGPEAGVDWTACAAIKVVARVLSGDFKPGFQTPARAYGADFVLECEGVTREDLK